MLMQVTIRPDLQQFWRKKWFTEYSPCWFCNRNFLTTLYVCFSICLCRLIWPDPSLFYFYIEFSFFLLPLSFFVLTLHLRGQSSALHYVNSSFTKLTFGKICVYAVFLTRISCAKQGICISVKENRICFGVLCFSHRCGILALGNFAGWKRASQVY